MIITRLSGGLGNQLFQYALGRALSLKNNDTLVLDTSFFDREIEPDRQYQINNFNIRASVATANDFKKIGIPNPTKRDFSSRSMRTLYRTGQSFLPLKDRTMVIEPNFSFIPEVLAIDHSCYLSGNWQSEKYFSDSATVIRKDLTLKHPLTDEAHYWVQTATECDSVSLHIRRGDYVTNQKTSRLHGVCSLEYYARAVEILRQEVPTMQLFVFSDDIVWAKQNLIFPYPIHFVSSTTIPDHEELIIMSTCKHHIIANSSFSWWGAWLDSKKEKRVIAPRMWFLKGSIPTGDLIPETWSTI